MPTGSEEEWENLQSKGLPKARILGSFIAGTYLYSYRKAYEVWVCPCTYLTHAYIMEQSQFDVIVQEER